MTSDNLSPEEVTSSYFMVEPSMRLRFVQRLGFRILQQAWISVEYVRGQAVGNSIEWRDVPEVRET